MSERTFRAVVASVLVGAFALAVVVAVAVLLPRSPVPTPSASVETSLPPLPTPSIAPTRILGPELRASVIGVGQIPRGGASGNTLVLQFLEVGVDAIPSAAGSFRVTLTDGAGNGSTVGFVGTPSVQAPGSLGATVARLGPNALLVSIRGSDPNNVELLSIRGLGIGASATAALGALRIHLDRFSGSLVTGAESSSLPPGTVVANP
jgi:hypothetical protein